MVDHPACTSPFLDFINVDVTIIPPQSGGSYTVIYSSKTKLDPIPVGLRDTVLRFRLVNTPASIVFVGMVHQRTKDEHHQRSQLSNYSISLDRRSLICSDVCTDKGGIAVTLQWVDGVLFTNDPQIGNIPVPPP